jgi:hypothetical protein
MSKRKRRAAEVRPAVKPSRAGGRARRLKVAVVVPLALCVLAAGAASLRWQPVRRAVGLAPLVEPQATPTPLALAKEYVYAGGRLVATEEPTPAFAGPPPTNLAAIQSQTVASQVDLGWSAPAGQVDHYEIGRKASVSVTEPDVVGSTQGPVTTFSDAASPDTAYLYSVRAVFVGGGRSAYSNQDLATTVIFSDDPLVGSNDPHPPAATVIKATHLTELRRAVSAVHALAGLGVVTSWTYPDPVSSPPSARRPIYLADVKDLRDKLDAALPALGRTPPAYAALTQYVTKVQAAHFQQIRDAVK